MSLPRLPLTHVFPLVSSTSDRSTPFLGTAFLIEGRRVMTAGHCLSDANEVLEGEPVFAVCIQPEPVCMLPIYDWRTCATHDISVGKIDLSPLVDLNEPEPAGLTVAAQPSAMDEEVVSYEFSETVVEAQQHGPPRLKLRPRQHRGYPAMAYWDSDRYKVETNVYDLPFPAVRGASGAPVLAVRTGEVVGMLLGNISRELVPAEIERVETLQGRTEVTRYHMPYARAITSVHLREALADLA